MCNVFLKQVYSKGQVTGTCIICPEIYIAMEMMLKFEIVLFCLLIFRGAAIGGRLHPQWCSLISDLCKKFEENPTGSSLIYLHVESTTENPFLHLIPPVLIWAPVEQFKDVFPNGFTCPKCEKSSYLYGYDWMNGIGSDRSEPRKIHGRNGVVILVGRVYKCSTAGHEVVGYHPGVIRQINAPSLIPFRLWARTGFTTNLTHDIETMIVSGVSASKIEANLASSSVLQYATKKSRFHQLQRIVGTNSVHEFPSYEQWCSFLPATAPSQHAITGCFLASFWEKHSLFEKHMQYTTITEKDSWLSCDHTFASAGELAS